METFFKALSQDHSYFKQTCSPTTLCLIIITMFVSIVKIIKSATKPSKLSCIPKLPSVPLFGPFYPLLWRNPDKLFTSWVSTYGPTFRTNVMGTEYVLLSNPKWLQKLLTSSDPGHMSKCSLMYDIMFTSILSGGLIPQSNIRKWKHHRSILSKSFSLESLKADLTVLNRHGNLLVDKMNDIILEQNAVESEGLVNYSNTLHAKLRESTYHTIADLFGGLNNLSKEEEIAVQQNISRCQDITAYRLFHPWCLSKTIWNFFPQKRENDGLSKSITTTFENLVNAARANMVKIKSRKTLMDFMIEGGLDNKEIVAELSNFSFATYESQSSALNYILYILALHPNYQAECRKEIDEILESQSESCASRNRDVSLDDLAQMKYLEMCIKESIRMFTPIPAFARELRSLLKLEENLVLDKGTVILVSPALIHRDPQVYPDPTIFNPERFLPEACKARSAYSFIPFSKGPRDCIGQRLSMVHLKLIVVYILWTYELYPGNPDDNLSKVWDTAVWPIKDLGVRWKKRTELL